MYYSSYYSNIWWFLGWTHIFFGSYFLMLTRRIGNVWNRCGPRLKNCNQGQVRWEFLGSLAPNLFPYFSLDLFWILVKRHLQILTCGILKFGCQHCWGGKNGFVLWGVGSQLDHHHAGSSRDLPAILKSHSTSHPQIPWWGQHISKKKCRKQPLSGLSAVHS